jgi:hypothetical protein
MKFTPEQKLLCSIHAVALIFLSFATAYLVYDELGTL